MRSGSADARSTRPDTVVHVVRPGDSLWSIARSVRPHGALGPVISRLVRDNGLGNASAVLQPGDRLIVPAGA